MLLDLFISDGNDAGWFLVGLMVVGWPVALLLLVSWFLLRTFTGIDRRRAWLVIGLFVCAVLVSLL